MSWTCGPVESSVIKSRGKSLGSASQPDSTKVPLNWGRTYWLTVMSTAGVTAMSALVWGLSLGSPTSHILIAGMLLLNCVYWSVRMIGGHGSCAAIAFFLLGSGLFYGFGPMFAVWNAPNYEHLSFGENVQSTMMPKINFMHCLSILLSMMSAYVFFMDDKELYLDKNCMHKFVNFINRKVALLMIGSLIYGLLIIYTFPVPNNIALIILITVFKFVPYLTIIIMFVGFDRLSRFSKIFAILLTVFMMFYGLIALSKSVFFLPLVCVALGLLLGSGSTILITSIISLSAVAYFGLVQEVINFSRLHPVVDPMINTIPERIAAVRDSFDLVVENAVASPLIAQLSRLSLTPFESHFMMLYDTGTPGNTVDSAAWVLVPRLFWPEKPVFDPGSEFDLIFRGTIADSNLALGHIAEGYYNLGWPGVVLVSVIAGLHMGYLTRKWLNFLRYGGESAGVFFLAPVVMFTSFWVEANFVGVHIAQFFKIFIIITVADVLVRIFYRRDQKMHRAL